jgi:hypothetical protein
MIAEKFQDMIVTFADNRDSHYRAQSAALQADINMIQKADLYSNKPLDDTGDEALDLIRGILGEGSAHNAPSPQADFAAQVGRFYADFVNETNNAMEERDTDISTLFVSLCFQHPHTP